MRSKTHQIQLLPDSDGPGGGGGGGGGEPIAFGGVTGVGGGFGAPGT